MALFVGSGVKSFLFRLMAWGQLPQTMTVLPSKEIFRDFSRRQSGQSKPLKRGSFTGVLSKSGNKVVGNRSRFSVADRSSVDRNHWNDFGRSSGQERFIGGEQIERREQAFFSRITSLLGEHEDCVSGDAAQ